MTANRNLVEREITNSLNDRQLGHNSLQAELSDLRHADPQHYAANLRLMQQLTRNCPGFPHIDVVESNHKPTQPRSDEKLHHDRIRRDHPSPVYVADSHNPHSAQELERAPVYVADSHNPTISTEAEKKAVATAAQNFKDAVAKYGGSQKVMSHEDLARALKDPTLSPEMATTLQYLISHFAELAASGHNAHGLPMPLLISPNSIEKWQLKRDEAIDHR